MEDGPVLVNGEKVLDDNLGSRTIYPGVQVTHEAPGKNAHIYDDAGEFTLPEGYSRVTTPGGLRVEHPEGDEGRSE